MSRLTRLDVLFEEHPVYFITTCTDRRKKLLDNEVTHTHFAEFCRKSKNHGILVGKYVLMQDHIHLFVCVSGALGLSAWMKSLKNSLSKHWRDRGIDSPHWQKGFFDHLIRNDESHAEKWKYVADNPVRAGLCTEARDWPYSGEINPTAHR